MPSSRATLPQAPPRTPPRTPLEHACRPAPAVSPTATQTRGRRRPGGFPASGCDGEAHAGGPAAEAATCALSVLSLPCRPLTAVILVAVVGAVIILVASPHRGDAALVPAPELVLFAFLDRPCAGERGSEPDPRTMESWPQRGVYWGKGSGATLKLTTTRASDTPDPEGGQARSWDGGQLRGTTRPGTQTVSLDLAISPHSDTVTRTLGPQSEIHADMAHREPTQTRRDTVTERCGHSPLSRAALRSRQHARVPGNALSGGEVAWLRSPPPQSARVK